MHQPIGVGWHEIDWIAQNEAREKPRCMPPPPGRWLGPPEGIPAEVAKWRDDGVWNRNFSQSSGITILYVSLIDPSFFGVRSGQKESVRAKIFLLLESWRGFSSSRVEEGSSIRG
jgi:hypothetical protein